MDLTQLRMFCAVADCGSVTLAARELHRVPSNLTTRLKQLENELGVALFIREHPRLTLSQHGHHLLVYARRILALSDEARVALTCQGPAGPLRLGSMECTAAVLLPGLLARYHRDYPAVALSLKTGSTRELRHALATGEISAAFVDGPVPAGDLEARAVMDDELVLVTDRERATVRTARDLGDDVVFTFRPGCSYRDRMEAWYAADGARPGGIQEIHSYHAMLGCVASGAGVAMMPASVVATLPGHDAVACHRLAPEHARVTTWLIWPRQGGSPAIDALSRLAAPAQR
ncbi:LysR family transcriptional regulator [Paludibacterium paludis]|uniref:LysR family transcriptional regulator n=1 Tax=Paludibacterium paludis TaxID=1225769 RepID=A0A918NXI1_9NEIS|nr:LysR family transcriptional regulator [Paludibacterium paludis]GGY02916.1 LysR family transcriptional regulator [Paludibacterium paludis]